MKVNQPAFSINPPSRKSLSRFRLVTIILCLLSCHGCASYDETPGSASNETRFIQDLARNELLAIQLSELAASRAQSNEVRQFAVQSVQVEREAFTQLREFAGANGIGVQESLSRNQRRILRQYEILPDRDFDRYYVRFMDRFLRSQTTAIREFVDDSQNETLNALIRVFFPRIEEIQRVAADLNTPRYTVIGNGEPGTGL